QFAPKAVNEELLQSFLRLQLHADKTRMVEFGRFAEQNRRQRGEGKPETLNFLRFTHTCGRTRKGHFRRSGDCGGALCDGGVRSPCRGAACSDTSDAGSPRSVSVIPIRYSAMRCYPRWEPDALVALVRICGGGREPSRSLLRPGRRPYWTADRIAPLAFPRR